MQLTPLGSLAGGLKRISNASRNLSSLIGARQGPGAAESNGMSDPKADCARAASRARSPPRCRLCGVRSAYSMLFSEGVGFALGCDCDGIPGSLPVFSYS